VGGEIPSLMGLFSSCILTGAPLGKEVFTDLDFADDVSLLAEMLEVLVLALTVMQEEAFGLQINWSKTKILQVPSSTSSATVQVADGQMDMLKWSMHLFIWDA